MGPPARGIHTITFATGPRCKRTSSSQSARPFQRLSAGLLLLMLLCGTVSLPNLAAAAVSSGPVMEKLAQATACRAHHQHAASYLGIIKSHKHNWLPQKSLNCNSLMLEQKG